MEGWTGESRNEGPRRWFGRRRRRGAASDPDDRFLELFSTGSRAFGFAGRRRRRSDPRIVLGLALALAAVWLLFR